LGVEEKERRLKVESGMVGTIAQCSGCIASRNWLGRHHSSSVIRESGLWNIHGRDDAPFDEEEIEAVLAQC